MAIRNIVYVPEPVLRKKAHKITTFDKDLNELIEDMIETLRAAPGVGLAAPQVGISQQLIVIEYAENEEQKPKLYVVINPDITKPSEEKEIGVEACLSIPGIAGEVDRHLSLTVKGLNRFGKPIKIKASGWLARIFQHEIDHLEGVLFTDRATRVWRPSPEEMAEIPD
ncbi:MAG: peptide deformylase [Chloroflexi bacterium HGW-Chloroflexi-8]|jgi:peptide deformylase|nr:MAG: peptide deformylase [Chloroflexi bacterium HGW-Chloroflexi-8]